MAESSTDISIIMDIILIVTPMVFVYINEKLKVNKKSRELNRICALIITIYVIILVLWFLIYSINTNCFVKIRIIGILFLIEMFSGLILLWIQGEDYS